MKKKKEVFTWLWSIVIDDYFVAHKYDFEVPAGEVSMQSVADAIATKLKGKIIAVARHPRLSHDTVIQVKSGFQVGDLVIIKGSKVAMLNKVAVNTVVKVRKALE